MRLYRTNSELLNDLEEKVEGHIEARKALITLVNRSKWRHHQKFVSMVHSDFLLSPSKILLIGGSGSGKTHLVESLQQICNFPLVRLDATHLAPSGGSGAYKPETVTKMIKEEAAIWVRDKHYRGAEFNSLEGAIDQTIVFVDEIDKLGISFDSSGNWNSHIQSSFLTLFDNKGEFSGVSFIFAGAFSGVFKRADEKNRKSFGFTNNTSKCESAIDYDEELVKAGLIPELVGRLTNIVELDRFDEGMLYNILKKRLLPKKQMDLAAMHIFDIHLSERRAREMAAKAFKSKQGVRALQRELEREFLDKEFYYENEQVCFPQTPSYPEEEFLNDTE